MFVIKITDRFHKKARYFTFGGKNCFSEGNAFHFGDRAQAESIISQTDFVGADKVEIVEIPKS